MRTAADEEEEESTLPWVLSAFRSAVWILAALAALGIGAVYLSGAAGPDAFFFLLLVFVLARAFDGATRP